MAGAEKLEPRATELRDDEPAAAEMMVEENLTMARKGCRAKDGRDKTSLARGPAETGLSTTGMGAVQQKMVDGNAMC